ncbi:organic cation/carnitine transporter 2-like [Amblyomma americanum]
MARRKRSRSLVSGLLPNLFRPAAEQFTNSETETLLQTLVVFGFGRFQKLVLLSAVITTFVAYSNSFAVATDLEPVEHWCRPSTEYSNTSAEAWKNLSLPRLSDSAARFNRCHRYETSLAPTAEVAGADAAGEPRAVVACDAWDYDTHMTGRTVVVQWNMVCHRAWYQHLLSAAFMCGGALSVPFAGLTSNRWGRRPVMWTSLGALLCSGVATLLAPTAAVFVMLRFVSSAAVSVLEVVAYVLLFESTPPGPREAFCALAVCWPTVLAPVYVGGIAYLALDWRVCHAGLVAPALALILTVYFTEESPHWLIVNKRFLEARRVALWAAWLNNEDPEIVVERLEKVKEMLAASAGGAEATNRDQQDECYPAAHLPWLRYLSSRIVLAHCFVIFGCWFTLYVSYYTRDLNLPHISALKWVVIIGNAPAMTLAYFITKHRRLRTPLVVFLLAVSLLLLFQTALQHFGLIFPAHLGLMWRVLLLNIAYVLLCVHTVALFPTQIRSVAFSGAYMSGRLGAMASAAFRVVEDALPSDLAALPLGVAAVHTMFFSMLLLTLSEKALLKEVTRAGSSSGAATPQRNRKRKSPASVSPKRQ